MNTLQRGIWSGTIATSAMTIGFLEFFKELPRSEKSPVPPGTITTDLLKKSGLAEYTDSESRQALALLSHFGYGTSFALLYSALSPGAPGRGIAKGTAFGLGVWAFSYLGLLPALGVRARAANMPLDRNIMMILLHVIWGASLGYTEERLRISGKPMFDGKLKKPRAE